MTAINQLILKIEDLSVTRFDASRKFIVQLPCLELYSGQILALTGQSGSGKSTLLEVLGLILKPDNLARFELNLGKGNELDDLSCEILEKNETLLAQIRSQALGFILQTGGLLPFLNVRENIFLTRSQKGLPNQADWITDIMVRLNIKRLADKMPHQLSIGERQRVAFIRAIAHEPLIVLADEPTAALDPYTAETLFVLMQEIAKERQLSILLVSHDWKLIEKHGFKSIQAKSVSTHRSVFEYV
ncbi:ABC transporter ATP-binding protein [Thorsellia anophelis]|uniref:Putative ABC transport system ATP-binding protein n=1 Tax=Thorsellia anophelis DSM 18579 TaxID=1123402 RepID=A0A1H9ZQW7_9GAMM|nr:ABC transporter ATP-binding protein [Thorsellia anophelis]SES84188.1 putative ABC transport system ATP-binding protein [Thorsellia anophelis DSM 18579]